MTTQAVFSLTQDSCSFIGQEFLYMRTVHEHDAYLFWQILLFY